MSELGAINIIIDESKGNEAIFVEIDTDSGKSIRIGERTEITGNLTSIRIRAEDIMQHESI